MFIDTYIAIPLWIFGIFGFIYLSLRMFDALDCFNFNKKNRNLYTVVITCKNQEENIEGIVKDLILKAKLYGAEDQLLNIMLVDHNSKDKTPVIIERLKGIL